jgi:hypothetical protein
MHFFHLHLDILLVLCLHILWNHQVLLLLIAQNKFLPKGRQILTHIENLVAVNVERIKVSGIALGGNASRLLFLNRFQAFNGFVRFDFGDRSVLLMLLVDKFN